MYSWDSKFSVTHRYAEVLPRAGVQKLCFALVPFVMGDRSFTRKTHPTSSIKSNIKAELVDANNVRGAMYFPELGAFCRAVYEWAHERTDTTLVVLVLDHGEQAPYSFHLTRNLVMLFSGKSRDADDIIVESVDWCVRQHDSCIVRVHTSDRLLSQRCARELPNVRQEWLSGQDRSCEHMARILVNDSSGLARQLYWYIKTPMCHLGSSNNIRRCSCEVFLPSTATNRWDFNRNSTYSVA